MRKIVALLLLLFLVVSPVLADTSYNDGSVATTGLVHLTTYSALTSEKAVLHYTITGTASKSISSITITPQVWKHESPENVLMFTGEPVTCTNTIDCTADGTFTPPWDFTNVTATYFTEGPMQYTVLPHTFHPSEAKGSTDQHVMSYQSGDAGLVPEVVVTRTLNLLGPGEAADPANANNTVPFGGIIEHGMQGDIPMTVVYDAHGQPQYLIDDRKTSDAFTPGGLKKATWVHEVPSGTLITETSESSLEYSLNGEKIGSIRSYYSYPADAEKVSNVAGGVLSEHWVEFAEISLEGTDPLREFSTQWTVPAPPVDVRPHTKIAMFNYISPSDGSEIFQPVLEYHWKDDPRDPDPGLVYSAAVWDIGEGKKDFTHSTRIYGLSQGDTVVGDIHWQEGYGAWYGQINKVGSSQSTSLRSTFFKKYVTRIGVTLEGHDCVRYPSLPRSPIVFREFTIKNVLWHNILTEFKGTVNRKNWNEKDYPGLKVEIRSKPTVITLQT